jgi:hypothetical protein
MDYLYTLPSSKSFSSSLPNLIDTRAKYYTQWWLQHIHDKKVKIYSIILNILVLGTFISVTLLILYFRYKKKPTVEEIEKQRCRDQEFVVNKIRNFQYMKKEQQSLYDKITDLPTTI